MGGDVGGESGSANFGIREVEEPGSETKFSGPGPEFSVFSAVNRVELPAIAVVSEPKPLRTDSEVTATMTV